MKLFDTLLKSWDIIPKEKVQSERGSMWSEWKSRNNTMFTITLFVIKINIKTYYQSMVHAQLDWNERVPYILKKRDYMWPSFISILRIWWIQLLPYVKQFYTKTNCQWKSVVLQPSSLREKSSNKDYKCKNTFVIEYCNGRDIIEW